MKRTVWIALAAIVPALTPWAARAGPYLVLEENSRTLVGAGRISMQSTLWLRGLDAVRAIEIRVARPSGEGESAALVAGPTAEGAVMLPVKTIEEPSPSQVLAEVLPESYIDVASKGPLMVASLEFRSVPTGRPLVTAQAVMKDGSRVTIPVTHRQRAPAKPERSEGVTGLVLTPNPSMGGTDIRYVVPSRSWVEAGVYDVRGRKIRGVFQGNQDAGERSLRWDGRDDQGGSVPLGIYFLRLRVGTVSETGRIILIR